MRGQNGSFKSDASKTERRNPRRRGSDEGLEEYARQKHGKESIVS